MRHNRQYCFFRPYPNPFNATQSIPVTGKTGHEIQVSAYNLLGQKVDIIYSGKMTSPDMVLEWDASAFPSGMYFIRASSGEAVSIQQSLLLK